jgi:hypothetical protein
MRIGRERGARGPGGLQELRALPVEARSICETVFHLRLGDEAHGGFTVP